MAARRIIRPPHPTQPAIDAVLAAPAFRYHGDKKYALNVVFAYDALPMVDLAAIGYGRPEGKLAQLRRHYINEPELIRASEMLERRGGSDLTSVGISFRGLPKAREGSQGWCIESMALVVANGKCYATAFYRCSELICKFAADLVLLREVFDRLKVNPARVQFHFALAWVGMQFLPTMFRSVPAIPLLERLREQDRTLWVSATWYLTRYVSGNALNFGPADRQMRLLAKSMDEDQLERLREYLREHGRLKAAA